MGCDFSHGDLRMSYGGFAALREKLAREAGLPLDKIGNDVDAVLRSGMDDPLVPLLATYDEHGGGQVAAKYCLALQRRIRELAAQWSEYDHSRELAERLAHAVAEAAFLGEDFYWF